MTTENNNQYIKIIDDTEVLDISSDLHTDGYRLSQICASKIDDKLEILYIFEKNSQLKNLKTIIDCKDPVLQSISPIYHASFIYENEMHDLFGIKFKNLELDYGGKFFKISEETPWNPKEDKGGAE